ncbi:hypothetical protein [Fibrobacter sp. UWB11]|uniref:hypothetical protein n=1 Tax=Fibrobacter sp. UWB11 TaxID=1896202 RepID=UPI0009279536|nr:hypothetical protein [Fibrobacter sp. UWB11]SIN96445.1 hypothetical protein SAMN05720758_0783 [Fibrobacter sp. UWB11]
MNLRYLICCLFLLTVSFSFANDDENREIRTYEFQSSQEAFLDFDHPVKTASFMFDAEQAENAPIATILNFYWCWSQRDDSPRCKIEFLDEAGKPILTGNVVRKNETNCFGNQTENCEESRVRITPMDKWIPLKKEELKNSLGDKIEQVKSVHMYQDTETSLGWGIFAGLYGAIFVALTSMVVEIPVSYALDEDYNWKHVGLASLVGFVGFSTWGVIRIAKNPDATRVDVTIKF